MTNDEQKEGHNPTPPPTPPPPTPPPPHTHTLTFWCSETNVLARTTSRVVTPKSFFGLYTPSGERVEGIGSRRKE